jgi:hypothetical protein
MLFVKQGISPLTEHEDVVVPAKIRIHSAVAALAGGSATVSDIGIIAAASNLCTALVHRGKGEDWRPEIRASADAIEAIQLRLARWGKVQALAAEVEAISIMAQVHDLQLDASTVIDAEQASIIAQRGVRVLGQPPANP